MSRFTRHLDRDDLILEPALRDGLRRAFLALQRKGVLRGAADIMFVGDVFRRHAHMPGAEGAVQRAEHHVERLHVTHLCTPALVRA